MTGGGDSFVLFRRFKKKKLALGALFFSAAIAAFHTQVGNNFSKEWCFFLGSVRVVLNRCSDKFERIFPNIGVFSSGNTEDTLPKLRRLNEQLREEIEILKHLQQENEELRRLLSVKESMPVSVKTARVVDIFSNDFTQSIILNVGKADGISVGDAVKNSDGLIGRVTEANETWSRVLLITDMNSGIPVKIGETPVNAIMTGGNSDNLFISTIHEDIQISDGDEVRTSGYGICEDIYVGKIAKNDKKNMVKSPVDFNSLKYVIIINNT
jgi:rod shape-determining protein MreC